MNEHQSDAWQIIESKTLFVHPRITLIEDTVVLPGGERTAWLRFGGAGDSVGLLCVDEQRRVLVAREYNPAPGRVVYEFPGGGVEAGESYVDAARREIGRAH